MPEEVCCLKTFTYELIWPMSKFIDEILKSHLKEIQIPENIKDPLFQVKLVSIGDGNGSIYFFYNPPVGLNNIVVNAYIIEAPSKSILETIAESIVLSNASYSWNAMFSVRKTVLKSLVQRDYYSKSYSQSSKRNLSLKINFTTNCLPSNLSTISNNNTPLSQMCGHLQVLLDSEMYSDMILESSDGIQFKVHKAIMTCRSNVLKAFLAHETEELTTNIIKSEFDSIVLKEVLNYIYGCKIEEKKVKDLAKELFVAADYYDIAALKNICELSILKNLTVENAIDFLMLSEKHSALRLKKLILEFISKAKEEVLKSAGWNELSSIDLTKDIILSIVES